MWLRYLDRTRCHQYHQPRLLQWRKQPHLLSPDQTMLLALVHCPQTLGLLYMVITPSPALILHPLLQVCIAANCFLLAIIFFSSIVLPSTPISQFPAYPRLSSSSTAFTAATVPQPSPTTPTPSQPAAAATAAAPVKLQLNKQQLAVAHKMFEEAPTLTREQKALILGFMAGSRGIKR